MTGRWLRLRVDALLGRGRRADGSWYEPTGE